MNTPYQKRSVLLILSILFSLFPSATLFAAPITQEETAPNTQIQLPLIMGGQDNVPNGADEPFAALSEISDDGASIPADQLSGGIAASSNAVRAAGVLPTSLFDPDETGWASYRGYSSADFSALFNELKDDYMMLDIEVDEIGGDERVSAIWQRNTTNRGWAEWRNLTSSGFHDKWTELRDDGYRLIDQEAYTLNGKRRYAGVWVKNTENLSWASWRNMTSSEFSTKFHEMKDDYIMVDVEGYSTSDGLRYAMIWVENTEELSWYEWRNMSSESFSEKFEQYRGTHRILDVESYRHNGTQYYAVIWVENTNGRGWAEYRDMSKTGYRNRWYRMRDLGYRLVDFEIYPSSNGDRYAGVWRQNNDLRDWHLRTDVNEMVSDYFDDNDLVGLGVAIAQGGKIRYNRGFGYQDEDAGIWYSSRTLNRLASVAKLVSGVLTMHLNEQGDIDDIDDPTADYIPTLPAHHTHSLRQILANRSGIGHYAAYNVATNQYNTALAAAQTFWNTDSNNGMPGTQLVYNPGTACIYSTHGHTILGAALEGATGTSISNIIEDELSVPYGLPTLQVENRSDGDANRSQLYDEDNDEVGADNISWKVLGGGMESSAYDLMRFGMKMINGSIISEDSLNDLQQIPAPTNCTDPNWGSHNNYGLGLQAGTHKGETVLWKGGNQRGANTAIRIYPEKDIVIVVLANRNEDHSTGSLARDLGTLLLDNPPPVVLRPVIIPDLVFQPTPQPPFSRFDEFGIVTDLNRPTDESDEETEDVDSNEPTPDEQEPDNTTEGLERPSDEDQEIGNEDQGVDVEMPEEEQENQSETLFLPFINS